MSTDADHHRTPHPPRTSQAQQQPWAGDSAEDEFTPKVSITVPQDPAEAATIQLTGEIDVYDGQLIRAVAATAVATQRAVRVNCQDLTFMDSSALILFAALARARLPMTVIGLRPDLRELLKMTALDGFMDFCDQ